MTPKENFNELLQKKGYSSLHDFCMKQQIDYANMNKRVNGKKQKIEIAYAFKLANMLKVPVDEIIAIFYPEEYAENQQNTIEELNFDN
jgi:hypothetical protein